MAYFRNGRRAIVAALSAGIALCGTHAVAAIPPSPTQQAFECAAATGALSPEQARKVLSSLQSSYDAAHTLRAQFEQESYLASLDITEHSSGVVTLSKPGRMKWHYETPEEQLFLIRDETLWFYQPEERQVTIDSFSRATLSDVPVAFLMGLGDIEKSFSIIRACRSGASTIFELASRTARPHESGEGVKSLTLRADCGSQCTIRGARVSDIAGNVTAITLHEVQEGVKLSEAAFELSYPMGTDVNDRR